MTSRTRNWLIAIILISLWMVASEMDYQDALEEQKVMHGN